MAYQAITVYGTSFQRFLLDLGLFILLTCARDSTHYSNPIARLLKISDWLIYFSQPLTYIRLSTYPAQLRDGSKLGLDCSSFARHYSQNRWLLSFPRPTKMFQFRRFPFNYPMYSGNDAHDMTHGGFPHSEISGSKLVDSSPKLIAVFHVLHR